MKYFPEITEVCLIGYKPDWCTNVTHIPFNDIYNKPKNIYTKLRIAADHYDRFIYANDDHFLLQPLTELPYYHAGPLSTFKGGGETFMRYVAQTVKRFPDGLYFDVHTPMVCESSVVKSLKYDGDLLFKSLYGNTAGVDGVEFKDCKLHGHSRMDDIVKYMDGRWFLSTSDPIPMDLKKWFAENFPDKSRFEL